MPKRINNINLSSNIIGSIMTIGIIPIPTSTPGIILIPTTGITIQGIIENGRK